MSIRTLLCCGALLLMFSGAGAWAQDTGTQPITIVVNDVNEVAIDGTPSGLVVQAAQPGQQPAEVVDESSTYRFSSNRKNSISASLSPSTPLPAGVTLKLYLTPPSGGSSTEITLSPSPQVVVSGMKGRAAAGLTIRYRLTATVDAGTVSTGMVNIVYTFTN
jgi:hypothetical protein